MSVMQPSQLAEILKSKKTVLLMAGSLCDEVDFNGKKLLDYAVEIANNLNMFGKTPNKIHAAKKEAQDFIKELWERIDYLDRNKIIAIG